MEVLPLNERRRRALAGLATGDPARSSTAPPPADAGSDGAPLPAVPRLADRRARALAGLAGDRGLVSPPPSPARPVTAPVPASEPSLLDTARGYLLPPFDGPATPAPEPEPFAVSPSGPRVAAARPWDTVQELAREYGVTAQSETLPPEYRRRALDALRGDDSPESALYSEHLSGAMTAEQYRAAATRQPGGVLSTDALAGTLGARPETEPVAADATRPGGRGPLTPADVPLTRLDAYRARTGDERTDEEIAASLTRAADETAQAWPEQAVLGRGAGMPDPLDAVGRAVARDAALDALEARARAEDDQDTSPEALRRRLARYEDETGFVERLGNRIGMGADGIETTREVQRLVTAYDRLDRLKAMRDASPYGGGMTRAQLQDGGAFEQMDLARDPDALAAEIAELERWIPERTAVLARVQARGQARPRNPAASALSDADSFGAAGRAFAADPLGVIGEIAIPSAVQMAPALAVAGATGGTLGLPGVAASIGVGSGMDEYTSFMVGRMAQAGVDVTDPEALTAAFSDRAAMAEMQRDARTRGLVVGSVDALSSGLAAAHVLPAAARSRLAGRLADAVGALGVQAGLGGAGEALGSLAVGDDVSAGAVAAEAIGELGSGAGEILAARNAEAAPVSEGVTLADLMRVDHDAVLEGVGQMPNPAQLAPQAAEAQSNPLGQRARTYGRAPQGDPAEVISPEVVAEVTPVPPLPAPIEPATPAEPTAPTLSPEAQVWADALPFAANEEERRIVEAELARLTNAPAPAPDVPAAGPAAAGPDRALGADAAAVAAPLPAGGRAGGDPVDAPGLGGRPVAAVVAPAPADAPAVAPRTLTQGDLKARVAADGNLSALETEVRAAVDSGAPVTLVLADMGREKRVEVVRTTPLGFADNDGNSWGLMPLAMTPGSRIEIGATSEQAVVAPASAAYAFDLDAEGNPLPSAPEIVTPAPETATPSRTAPARAEGQPVASYVQANSAALLADAQAEIAEAVDPADYADPAAVQEAQFDAATRSENPVVLAEAWRLARASEDLMLDPSGSAEGAIAAHIGFISTVDLADAGADLPVQARKAYFRRSTFQGDASVRSVVEVAEQISAESGVAVTAEDVLDFVRRYPSGTAQYRADVRRPRRQVEARWREVTGEPVTEKRVTRVLEALTPPAAVQTVEPARYGEQNRVVTQEAYERALAGLGRMDLFSNPLPDAETLNAWATIAGYHIEAGARSFADFSGRMLADLGAAVGPHLDRLFADAGGTTDAPEAPALETTEPATLTAQDVLARIAARRAAGTPPQAPATPSVAPAPGVPASESAPTREAPPVAPTAPSTYADPVSLTKADGARIREALGLDALPAAQRQTWTETVERVVASGLVAEMDARAALIVSAPKGEPAAPLSADEHAALLVRLAQVQARYRELADAVRESDAQGVPADEMRARAVSLLHLIDLLTRASDMAGSEVGRALAVRRLAVQNAGESFTVASAVRDAETMKGAPLTDAERDRIAVLAHEADRAAAALRAHDDRRQDRSTDAAAARADAAVDADAEATRTTERDSLKSDAGRVKREAAIRALRDERARIKADLAALGLRVNDVIGLTVEGADLVRRLALNYAREHAYTLAEVVSRVRADLPGLSGEDVVRAIAGPQTTPAAADAERVDLLVRQARARNAVRAAQRALVTPTIGERLWEIPNLARTVMTTGDMGSVFNQAAPLASRHPVLATRAFATAWRAFFREASAERIDAAMRADAAQARRESAGLFLAPLGDAADAVRPDMREEAWQSRRLQRLPAPVRAAIGAVAGAAVGTVKYGPGVGTVFGAAGGTFTGLTMEGSERHMVVFLNTLRASVFDLLADGAGPDVSLPDLKQTARLVNLTTGRGEMTAEMARKLSLGLFSARLTAARFQAPLFAFRKGVPRALRIEAAKTFGAFVGSRLVFLTAAKMLAAAFQDEGDDPLLVGDDPRDADFGKIVWGPLRIDVWGGYATQARIFLRVALAGSDAYGFSEAPAHRQDIDPMTEAGRYVNGKKAPWIGTLLALLTLKGFDGKPATPTETLADAFSPMGFASAAEAYQTGDTEQERERGAGWRRAFAAFLSNFFGNGADAYDDPTQSSSVKPFFERAEYRALPAAPDGLTPADKDAYEADFRRRLAGFVERDARDLARIAERDDLKERLEGLVRTARLEARGQVTGDPLLTPDVVALFGRADYTPAPSPPADLGGTARAAYETDFRRRLAAGIERRSDVLALLSGESLKERLQELAGAAREEARAEATGDPLGPVLGTFQRADYRAHPYAPAEMPEEERGAYGADFRRRLASLVAAEGTALDDMALEDLKDRLRSLASTARSAAREAAGY
ncbi:MAG TPA: hypothetical protein VGB53_01625 [Rubricoccaceae bacterium]